MGVRHLWPILRPYEKKINIVELQGKLIAVDLSCWVCDNQCVLEKYQSRQQNLHLRSAALLMSNVTPLFILDGDPPDVKQSMVSKRNKLRYPRKKIGNVPNEKQSGGNKGLRKMFRYTLKECQEMLSLLGLKCIWSSGEAEALCAFLNKRGVVDGVVTEDSDSLLYGARTTYRNLMVQGGVGFVDVFEMPTLEEQLNLNREKLVAMSLLCGCDYEGTGISGIGPEKTLKYLSHFNGDILQRLGQLKFDKVLEKYEEESHKCRKCHHYGKQTDHTKFGCKDCETKAKCIRNNLTLSYDLLTEDEKVEIDFELKIRKQLIDDPTFPLQTIIDEYMNFSQDIPEEKYNWEEPDLAGFLDFMEKKCQWSRCYSFEKIAPLICRWAILNRKFTNFIPNKIVKKCVQKAVPCFVVEWTGKNVFICPCDLHECAKKGDIFTTIEPQILIMDVCKDLYNRYVTESMEKKLSKKLKNSKSKRTNAKINKEANNAVDSLSNVVSKLSLNDLTNKTPKINRSNSNSDAESQSNRDSKIGGTDSDCCFRNSSSDKTENTVDFDCLLDDFSTMYYDVTKYEIDESLIVDTIISRKKYY